MTIAIEELLNKVKIKKDILASLRPLDKSEIRRLQEDFIIESTYNSNAIEGSTITLDETYMILKEGITVGGKSLKEHLEIIGFKEAFDYVLELAKNKESALTERDILDIHYLVLQDNKQSRGIYRSVPVRVGSYIAPQPYLIRPLMENLLRDNEEWSKDNILEAVSKFHLEFETIHPFIDGNGRTSRLLMNLELLKAGYPPCVITVENRLAYYEALDQWMAYGKAEPFIQLVAEAVLEGFKPYQVVLSI